jgi:hypothetical protein
MICTVYNLATGREYVYAGLELIDALVSAAILEDKRAGDLTNLEVRELYKKKLISGKSSLSIGDLTVYNGE